MREFIEETNASIFNKKASTRYEYELQKEDEYKKICELYEKYKEYNIIQYIDWCKYVLHICYMPYKQVLELNLIPDKFLTYEIEESKDRIVNWVSNAIMQRYINDRKVSPRLKKLKN
jgi:hypothetical protein